MSTQLTPIQARLSSKAPSILIVMIVLLVLPFMAESLVASTLSSPEAGHNETEGVNGTKEQAGWPDAELESDFEGTGPIYGVNFISSAEGPADEEQYQNGLATGAAWNRWPIYWFNVEQNPGDFDWSAQDATVNADIEHGLNINAILLGTPLFYTTSNDSTMDSARPDRRNMFTVQAVQAAAPLGLYEPVFDDGSDVPGPGKSINEENVWARFVYLAVNRYKPGGILAQLQQWPVGAGVVYWEMWNEPDLPWFWDSSLSDYARLLKTGYLAAKQADPAAQVLFGGLANSAEKPNYYEEVLRIYDGDPQAMQHAYFHDILATHSYFYAWQSWNHVWRATNTLADRGLDKVIWLNETGVPAWDDYPGPVWDSGSPLRATMSEQADFIIQSAFYAIFAGADAYFHFQLYDGCGNQPSGTDFPPHYGDLCSDPDVAICAGDANGLFRNPSDAACFTQHPMPETPRPNHAAYKVLTDHVTNVEPLWRLRPGGSSPYDGPQEWIAFYQPESRQRIVGLWSRVGAEQTAVVTATHSSGLLVAPDGSTQTIAPKEGHYNLQLPAATNQNAPWDPSLFAIGGRPILLIETDTMPPSVTVNGIALPHVIELTWEGNDNFGSGIESYDVSVSEDGGPNEPWLQETKETGVAFPADVGRNYTFFVSARDRAGNIGAPGAFTTALPDLVPYFHLPVFRGP